MHPAALTQEQRRERKEEGVRSRRGKERKIRVELPKPRTLGGGEKPTQRKKKCPVSYQNIALQ
jgi:hypothetical protein